MISFRYVASNNADCARILGQSLPAALISHFKFLAQIHLTRLGVVNQITGCAGDKYLSLGDQIRPVSD
jgi:hypothetical protein